MNDALVQLAVWGGLISSAITIGGFVVANRALILTGLAFIALIAFFLIVDMGGAKLLWPTL